MKSDELLKKGDGLLIVDVQNDFCPGGTLPIDKGDLVVPELNDWIEAAEKIGIPVYASRDFHPKRHISFKDQGGPWPSHCVEDSEGASFYKDLKLPDNVTIITKGVRFDQDQNSVFDQTGFAEQLRHDGVRRIWVGGLAQDVCVLLSVLDARKAGFDVNVIMNATRPVTPEGGRESIKKMEQVGAVIIED
ncbi:MAG: isochorismatase family protein [Nitrospiraceae bacterium]|nr:MAG: isochorismatase family protein [Nitrospiraceae bacterium]